ADMIANDGAARIPLNACGDSLVMAAGIGARISAKSGR
ncbi:MAG: hypothetical protein UU02_C0037G0007, partial [Candidatus Woesebacteria bacterium GW2011_GWA1_40_43]